MIFVLEFQKKSVVKDRLFNQIFGCAMYFYVEQIWPSVVQGLLPVDRNGNERRRNRRTPRTAKHNRDRAGVRAGFVEQFRRQQTAKFRNSTHKQHSPHSDQFLSGRVSHKQRVSFFIFLQHQLSPNYKYLKLTHKTPP